MKRLKIVSLSLILGGAFFLTGCLAIEWRARPEVEEVEEIVEVPEVEELIEVIEELATIHIVVRGETLWEIAGYEHIFGDPKMWRTIFEANRDILDHPDALMPGQELVIPRK